MDELSLVIDLHVGNERQGPGADDETRRAIELSGVEPDPSLRILDVGCGTGASALVLAHVLGGRVTGVDASERFVERLRERADGAGVSGRVDAVVGDMAALPFEDGAFDVVWSEGAVYNMGFETGLRAWRRLIRPGGVIGVSELIWTTAERPAEVEAHWSEEYPGVDTASAKLGQIERAGYRPMGYFVLPGACWEAEYYEPIVRALPGFLERHGHSDAARSIAEGEARERDLYRAYGAWYGYGFFVAGVPIGAASPG